MSQNGGRNQVSGRVSTPCWHATPVANAPWKPLNSVKVNFGRSLNRSRVGETGLNNQSTCKPPKRGRNQVSGVVRVPCWHATPVANAPWKPLIIGEGQARYQGHEIGGKSDWLEGHCWSRIRMSFNIRERDTSYC